MSQCAKCFLPASSHCSRCKTTHYCSRKCQSEHWKEHRNACLGAQMAKLPSTDPLRQSMANFYASQSSEDICKAMLDNPDYKRRKDDIEQRLNGGIGVKELFLRAIKSSSIENNAYVLLYQSLQAIGRCLDNKEQEGDFLGLHSTTVDELLKSSPNKANLQKHKNDTNMIYLSVSTNLPLSMMRPDLKDITVSHCVTVLTRNNCLPE